MVILVDISVVQFVILKGIFIFTSVVVTRLGPLYLVTNTLHLHPVIDTPSKSLCKLDGPFYVLLVGFLFFFLGRLDLL
jgi:hypothetical protein